MYQIPNIIFTCARADIRKKHIAIVGSRRCIVRWEIMNEISLNFFLMNEQNFFRELLKFLNKNCKKCFMGQNIKQSEKSFTLFFLGSESKQRILFYVLSLLYRSWSLKAITHWLTHLRPDDLRPRPLLISLDCALLSIY